MMAGRRPGRSAWSPAQTDRADPASLDPAQWALAVARGCGTSPWPWPRPPRRCLRPCPPSLGCRARTRRSPRRTSWRTRSGRHSSTLPRTSARTRPGPRRRRVPMPSGPRRWRARPRSTRRAASHGSRGRRGHRGCRSPPVAAGSTADPCSSRRGCRRCRRRARGASRTAPRCGCATSRPPRSTIAWASSRASTPRPANTAWPWRCRARASRSPKTKCPCSCARTASPSRASPRWLPPAAPRPPRRSRSRFIGPRPPGPAACRAPRIPSAVWPRPGAPCRSPRTRHCSGSRT
mmetsp:Transcript_15459/g.49647  ORF Transcript_15459/g.49647 Transcript_15459/m.49647 type:complete len:292 (-) Transcript_15459:74-949(-)